MALFGRTKTFQSDSMIPSEVTQFFTKHIVEFGLEDAMMLCEKEVFHKLT